MTHVKPVTLAGALLLIAVLGGAAPVPTVATTSIIGDVVAQVGGDRLALTVLFPPGTDPHAFEPTPHDLVVLSRARLVFVNGAGLEEGLARILASPELAPKVVDLSEGLPLREDERGIDPHVWLDPTYVMAWTERIRAALVAVDPAGAAEYGARAAAYRDRLGELDRWIQDQVASLPPKRRVLITDHWVFGYFAARYGFAEGGAIVPAYSTLAEPSPRERAALLDRIRTLGIPAVFVSAEFDPALAAQLARDSGVRVVVLFTESLSGRDGPAPDYLSLMRELVRRMVEALGK